MRSIRLNAGVQRRGAGAAWQRRRRPRSRAVTRRWWLLTVLLVCPSLLWSAETNELRLRLHELHTIRVEGLTRVAISQPTVIDVGIVSARQVLVKALAAGTSDLLLWDAEGQRKLMVVVEDPSVEQQLEQLQRLLGGSADFARVTVTREGQHLLVMGTVPSEEAQQRLDTLLSTFPATTNVVTLQPEGETSRTLVELNVQIIEMNRSQLDKLGIKWSESQTLTETVFPRVGPTDMASGGMWQRAGPVFKFGSWTRSGLSNTLNLLVRNGLARVLAEPRLVTRSGKPASSFVGGQVPVLTTTSTGIASGVVTTNIEFKDFGVSLEMTPTLSADGRLITTQIKAEVSSIDATNAITISNVVVPGFKVRRTQTEILTGPDESIFIAGLLQEEDSKTVDAVPGLGTVPVLGRLFKSSEFKLGQTELVITVTPHLVHPTPAAEVATAGASAAVAAASTAVADTSATVSDAPVATQDVLFQYALQVREQLARAIRQQPPFTSDRQARQVTLRLHLFADGSLGQVLIGQSSGDEQLDAETLLVAEQEAPYPSFPPSLSNADVWIEAPVVVNEGDAG